MLADVRTLGCTSSARVTPRQAYVAPWLRYARSRYALNREEVDGWRHEFTSRFGVEDPDGYAVELVPAD